MDPDGPCSLPHLHGLPPFLPSPLTGLPFSACLSATILPFPLHTNRGQQTAADRAHQPQPQSLSQQPLTWTPGRPEASIPAGWVSETLLFHRCLSSPSTPRDVPPHSEHRAAHANMARGCCRLHDTSGSIGSQYGFSAFPARVLCLFKLSIRPVSIEAGAMLCPRCFPTDLRVCAQFC